MSAVRRSSDEVLEELVQALIAEGVTAETFDLDQMPFAAMEQFGHGLGKQLAQRIQAALADSSGPGGGAGGADERAGGRAIRLSAMRAIVSGRRTAQTADDARRRGRVRRTEVLLQILSEGFFSLSVTFCKSTARRSVRESARRWC